jgi:hypothetical protein
MTNATTWLTAIAITLALGAYAAQASNHSQPSDAARAAHAEVTAQARRDKAASQACDGQPFAWDGPVLVCYREVQE